MHNRAGTRNSTGGRRRDRGRATPPTHGLPPLGTGGTSVQDAAAELGNRPPAPGIQQLQQQQQQKQQTGGSACAEDKRSRLAGGFRMAGWMDTSQLNETSNRPTSRPGAWEGVRTTQKIRCKSDEEKRKEVAGETSRAAPRVQPAAGAADQAQQHTHTRV